jgi:predicted membrane channel-forming protein YqfA (hemolysin III family)
MVVEAMTLALVSALHLSGQVTGRSSPFDADHAGIAEAIIGAVLAAGAAAMVRLPGKARMIGIIVNGLASAGFVLGLTMTVRGGHLPDIGYHLVVLPALIGSLVVLVRSAPT